MVCSPLTSWRSLRPFLSIYIRGLIYSVRELALYTSGCDDEETETFSGHDDQTFPCAGGDHGWHNVKMDNMAATGHKVILYSDPACSNEIGQVTKDGSCYVAPSDVSEPLHKSAYLSLEAKSQQTVISAYAIVMV
jgi:hypothetical protein